MAFCVCAALASVLSAFCCKHLLHRFDQAALCLAEVNAFLIDCIDLPAVRRRTVIINTEIRILERHDGTLRHDGHTEPGGRQLCRRDAARYLYDFLKKAVS